MFEHNSHHATDSKTLVSVAEEILGTIEWIGDDQGFAQCPGASLHTGNSGRRDCKVYLSPVPTVSCFHQSCRHHIEDTNRRLRSAASGGIDLKRSGSRRLTAEEKARIREHNRREGIRQRAAQAKDQVLIKWRWPVADIESGTVLRVPCEASDQSRAILGLFQPSDIVWIGDIHSSGRPEHAAHFRTAAEWMEFGTLPGPFVCPSTFQSGAFSRGNDHVAQRRFLVVESDTLPKDQVGAVFRWLREAVGLPLRAVVDTGGKSLHGWFDFPSEFILAELKLILPELECDPKLFTASQPVRMAGMIRPEKGNLQRLLFLDGKEVAR